MTDVLSLSTVATTQLAAARHARTGRAAKTIHGGHEATLRQTVLALTAGTALGEHDSPGQATLQIISGRVRLHAGEEQWEAFTGDYLPIPPARHDLEAIDDSVVLLTVSTTA